MAAAECSPDSTEDLSGSLPTGNAQVTEKTPMVTPPEPRDSFSGEPSPSAENISTFHVESSALINRLKNTLQYDIGFMPVHELSSAASFMANALWELNRRINSLAPVNRLPLEILTQIFQYATVRMVTSDPNERAFVPNHQPASYADLIHITHVCQFWRNVSLATPFLWNSVDDRNRARFEAIRTRAQSVPNLCYELSKPHDPYAIQSLRDDGPRVRWLNICTPDSAHEPFSSSHLQLDGSSLECVTMRLRYLTGGRDVAVPRLFSQKMLALKALAIYNTISCWFPGAKLQLPNLTHLYISQAFLTHPPVLSSLADLLRRTPRVQYLHLGDIPSVSSADLVNLPDAVSLPHLKRFTCLGSDPTSSIRLLSFLRLPPQVSVYIRQNVRGTEIESAQYWQLSSSELMAVVTRLVLTYFHRSSFRIIADSPDSGLWLSIKHTYWPLDFPLWFRRACSLVPLASIQVFDFLVNDDATLHILADILPLLPSLVAMRVQVNPDAAQIDAVRLLLAPGAPGSASTNSPLLATLCLHTNADPPDVDSLCAAGVTEMLAARAHAGLRIQHFALRARRANNTVERDEAEGGVEGWLARVEEAFSGAAAFADEVDVALYEATPHAFGMAVDLWSVPEEAERYWTLPSSARPY